MLGNIDMTKITHFNVEYTDYHYDLGYITRTIPMDDYFLIKNENDFLEFVIYFLQVIHPSQYELCEAYRRTGNSSRCVCRSR